MKLILKNILQLKRRYTNYPTLSLGNALQALLYIKTEKSQPLT